MAKKKITTAAPAAESRVSSSKDDADFERGNSNPTIVQTAGIVCGMSAEEIRERIIKAVRAAE